MPSLFRRALLAASVAGAASSIFSRVNAQSAPPPSAKREFIERAMEQWREKRAAEERQAQAREKQQGNTATFSSLAPPTEMHPFKDWDYHYIKGTGPIWLPNPNQTYRPVRVPTGFVTDLASIPQWAWSSGLKPEGPYTYASIVHDWLYWTHERPREEADKIFLIAMEDSEVDRKLREEIYKVVSSKMFGLKAWNRNKKLRTVHKERRVLRVFPDKFTITWADWKKDPSRFQPGEF